ncbi:MAG TPA: UbiA family prenyltransferase, partial [Miltoncostaeaceae bacterium]|nr:UbiA family prenyltransferase [Miltoncostaeaceae bacterium]
MNTTSVASPAHGRELVPALLSLVRFTHTVFALPFAAAAALLAADGLPEWAVLGWILLAMVGARTLAMALNRLIDARIDAANPRTAGRELPSGRVSPGQVWALSAVSLLALLVAVSQLPRITWVLWPIPVALFVLYPLAKRVTWACHLVLGVTIGIAPLGAWIAVTGRLPLAPILMGVAVA